MDLPFPSPKELAARNTYLALLHALSQPGRVRPWAEPPGSRLAALAGVGEALLDAETTFHAANPELRRHFASLGAVPAAVPDAEFLFADASEDDVDRLASECGVGTWLAPELGATLIVAAAVTGGAEAIFSGPGIEGSLRAPAPALRPGFWEIRSRRRAYPLGWDLFIVDEHGVTGVPRTTEVQFQNP